MSKAPVSATGKNDNRALWLALKLAWEMGYLIALPVLILGVGGAYADRYFGTMPLLTLGGFLLAAILSFITIKRRIRTIFQSS